MKVLVTGAGGYLGGRLCSMLTGSGHQVRAVARRPIPGLDNTVTADLATGEMDRLCDGVEAVVHLAGARRQAFSSNETEAVRQTCTAATTVARTASAAGVTRIVYISTVHVYGYGDRFPRREEAAVDPPDAYACSRLAAERILVDSVPQTVVLRVSNVVGAPQTVASAQWALAPNAMCRQAVTAGKILLYNGGKPLRDFVPLIDVCRAIVAALEMETFTGICNVASGRRISMSALAEMIAAETALVEAGRRPTIVTMSSESSADAAPIAISRLTTLGLAPKQSVRQAVSETVAFCHAQRNALA